MKASPIPDYSSLEKASDEELFSLSQKHPDIFRILFARHIDGFYKKALYIVGDTDEAQEIAQDAFVKIYSAHSSYRNMLHATWKSWAYRILVNQCFSVLRARNSRASIGAHLSETAEEYVEDEYQKNSLNAYLDRDYLYSLLVRLPRVLSATMRFSVFEQMPESQIAQLEGVSATTVRVRLFRARKELQKLILKERVQ